VSSRASEGRSFLGVPLSYESFILKVAEDSVSALS
jgi:hypothetical protein